MGVGILSVRLSHAWIVTKLNDALQIFLYYTKGQSLCYSDTNSGWWVILTIYISMVMKRNRGLSLDIESRYERAEHKTHDSNHKSQKLDTISATN